MGGPGPADCPDSWPQRPRPPGRGGCEERCQDFRADLGAAGADLAAAGAGPDTRWQGSSWEPPTRRDGGTGRTWRPSRPPRARPTDTVVAPGDGSPSCERSQAPDGTISLDRHKDSCPKVMRPRSMTDCCTFRTSQNSTSRRSGCGSIAEKRPQGYPRLSPEVRARRIPPAKPIPPHTPSSGSTGAKTCTDRPTVRVFLDPHPVGPPEPKSFGQLASTIHQLCAGTIPRGTEEVAF